MSQTDVGGQHCPCPVRVSFLPGFSGKSCPVSVCPDSVCLDSVRCQDSVRIFRKKAFRCLSVRTLSVSIPSAVRVLSGFLKKTLSAVCLSVRTRTRQSCPDFRCPCPPTSGHKDAYFLLFLNKISRKNSKTRLKLVFTSLADDY